MKRIALVSLVALSATVDAAPPRCPDGMTRIDLPARRGLVCIDRYEASLAGGDRGAPDGKGTTARAVSRKGAIPVVEVSWKQAVAACGNAGKRLCRRDEWTAACRGAAGTRAYPYGARYVAKRCNDRARSKGKAERPLPAGSLPGCRTPDGVFDLSGNVWEWIESEDPARETAPFLGGGAGNDNDDDNLSCTPEDPLGQPVTTQMSGLGFRCCADAPGGQ